jgi:dipeptidase E
VRALLLSNSGRPYLAHAKAELLDFLGAARRIGFVTAASSVTRTPTTKRAHRARAGDLRRASALGPRSVPALSRVDAVFVGGGNTYCSGASARPASWSPCGSARARGLRYAGSSAGSNVAGPNILTTNDWNVVGLTAFEALGLVPFNVNPHYLETDPAMAPGSETRDMRVAEYHVVRDNPVVGIEEGAMLRVENGHAWVRGTARAKLFRRGGARLGLPARLYRSSPARSRTTRAPGRWRLNVRPAASVQPAAIETERACPAREDET